MKKDMPFKKSGGLPRLRDFKAAISKPAKINLIAEIKFASPSAGVIRKQSDPVSIGRIYEKAGAAATFDWQLAIKVKEMAMPVILAGGLGPSNIAQAIRNVKPCAVDVNNGVEERRGKKDGALMKVLSG